MLELKQRILCDRNEAKGEGTSMGELMDADELVTDVDARAEYCDVVFTSDDFFCSAVECA